MPELPDITLYIEALRQRVHGCPLERSKISSAFLLRSVEPQLDDAHGAHVVALKRLQP
jgi:formamidopyrimidine-DNA glycosylase